MWKKKFRTLLKETLEKPPDESGKLTLRALATTLGISPGALSGIINGKRLFSERAAQQILASLPIPTERKKEFERQFKSEIGGERMLLKKEFEALLSHWYYLPILCFFEFEEPGPATEPTERIAKRLNLPPKEISTAIDALTKMGLLQESEEGRLEYIGPYWTTTDEISSQSVRQAHLNEFDLAAKALRKFAVEERDFTSITFAGNSEQLQKVKKEIRKFRDRVNQIMEEGDTDQVYKLNVQLFPVDGLGAD
jgi:uncharacterized protein (TIGR02147 family)